MKEVKYSPKVAREIFEKFKQKGWNVYRCDAETKLGSEEIIRQNFSKSLEVGKPYVLLPVADNPRDPKQVFNSLDALSQKLSNKMPTIKLGEESHPLTGVTLEKDRVKVHTPEGTFVTYPDFIKAMDSVIQV